MPRSRIKIVVTAAVAALGVAAVPAAAVPGENGKPESPGKPDNPGKQAKGVTYVFKGAYGGDGSTVAVDHTNKHARPYDEQTVQFDFSDARIKANDASGARTSNLSDVVAGERVVVKSRLPRKEPGDQPFAARQLIEQPPDGYSGETG